MDDLKKRGSYARVTGRLCADYRRNFGLKVRWVLGYDTLQLYVAIEQGEVQGRVKLYTDWQPEIMSMYKRLAHEAPK